MSPGCWLKDEAIEITRDGKVWKPNNYDHQFKGDITIRDTIKQSRNLPTVMMYQHLQDTLGERSFQKFGADLGLEIGLEPSVSLGSFAGTVVDMASAYTIFIDAGKWNDAQFVGGIVDRGGETVHGMYASEQRVISAPVAFMVQDILYDVVQDGTANLPVSMAQQVRWGLRPVPPTAGVTLGWLVLTMIWVGFDKARCWVTGGPLMMGAKLF